jgi:Eco57I restriction-modification methylase
MNELSGISGSLFPGRYLVEAPRHDDAWPRDAAPPDRRRRAFEAWWAWAVASCGPATGLRALFDNIAMPLVAMLGFRADDASFERGRVVGTLRTRGPAAAGLILLPWASRQAEIWRDVVVAARRAGAGWCFVLAPPYLSLVDARGHASRQSVDFTLPDVFGPASFVRFWTLAHAGAFETASPAGFQPGRSPEALIDRLVCSARRFQDRVRADLQDGVIAALDALAQVVDRRTPASGLRAADEALTLVYRLLFLFFAESRRLVPVGHPVYRSAYSVGALCREALSDDRAPGVWDGLAAITRLSRAGCRTEDLIVAPFNGRLFARKAAPSLESGRRTTHRGRRTAGADTALGRALVALGTRRGAAGRETISYADLGVEQLGAVYERVLDLDWGRRPQTPHTLARGDPSPRSGRVARSLTARSRSRSGRGRPPARHSARRKQTGTFYTPQPLAEFLVRRTLAPLVTGTSADRILSLRVVDPAMGSGAFLVAACVYLAGAYERALIQEGRCSETDLDDEARADVRRLVAERCLAGVDANPVAVQLARLSLWLATLARGKPLGFLDHRLRVGDSLVGASPDDLGRTPGHRGRDAGTALPLFDAAGLGRSMCRVVRPLSELARRRDDTVEDVRAKTTAWQALTSDRSPLEPWRLAASLWCARWFPDESPGGPLRAAPPSDAELRAALDAVLRGDRTLPAGPLARWLLAARTQAAARRFFHWPLEFADVFYDEYGQPRPDAGFDAVIGNPPWEMVRDDTHDAGDALDPGGSRVRNRRLIRFIRESGLYPSCGRGHLNLYQPFLERALSLARPGGRVGLVLPWGLAADDGAAQLRARLIDRSALDTIVGFDNAGGLFPIHRGLRFLVVVASPGGRTTEVRARFGVRTAGELADLPGVDESADAYPVRLTPGLIATAGGPARRLPDVRDLRDLAWLDRLARTWPPLGRVNGWGAHFGRELNATEDRARFGAEGLPVIEGKHIAPFAVDTGRVVWRIDRREALELLPDARFDRPRLAYRDVSGVGNRLSLIAAIVPSGIVTTHTLFCLRTAVATEALHFLCGLFNSFVLNAVVRLLMGGHVTTSLVEGLPVPVWTGSPEQRRIARFARHLAEHPDARRTNAALQAAVARLYDLDGPTFERLLAGFPLVAAGERRLALDMLTERA